MGWISYHRERGESNREHFAKEFPDWDILADSTVGGVWYAAVRHKNNPEEVFAAVFKMQWTRDYFNFTVKHMDETVGPCYHDAPAKVLDLLTPTTYEWANQWRQACRDNAVAKAAAKVRAKDVKNGTVIEVAHPLSFGRGRMFSRFRYTGDKAIFVALHDNGGPNLRVNLGRDWKSRFAFEVQPEAVTV